MMLTEMEREMNEVIENKTGREYMVLLLRLGGNWELERRVYG